MIESVLSSHVHVANVNNSRAAARAVENYKSALLTIISILKRDGHTYIHTDGLVASC